MNRRNTLMEELYEWVREEDERERNRYALTRNQQDALAKTTAEDARALARKLVRGY